MNAYASHTGTRRNLATLRAAGWRLLAQPYNLRTEGFGYALDNGAWSAFTQGTPWDAPAFERAVSAIGAGADWIVAPDIVAGGLASLRVTEEWLPRLAGIGRRRLIAVQDGMTIADVAPMLGDDVGVFVGGSTPWKLATMRAWGGVARAAGAYIHVGRVNTCRRIRLCHDAGADSFDGTSVSRYSVTCSKLDAARRQGNLYGGLPAIPGAFDVRPVPEVSAPPPSAEPPAPRSDDFRRVGPGLFVWTPTRPVENL